MEGLRADFRASWRLHSKGDRVRIHMHVCVCVCACQQRWRCAYTGMWVCMLWVRVGCGCTAGHGVLHIMCVHCWAQHVRTARD